jgi:hypothetical protein
MVITRKTEYLDDDEEVRDGESTRVRLDLMDAMQRRFGFDAVDLDQRRFAAMTPEVASIRQTTRAEYLAGLQDSWRSPAQGANPLKAGGGPKSAPDADADPMQARDEMVQRMRDGWRTPHDRAAPDLGSPPEVMRAAAREQGQLEHWQGRPNEKLAAEVEARRRSQHAQFSRDLENAWRG